MPRWNGPLGVSDDLGLQTQILPETPPLSSVSYSGISNTLSSPSSNRTKYFYDQGGRRTRIEMDRQIPAQGLVKESMEFGYDLMSRLTQETRRDEYGNVIYGTTWQYDAVGNRTHETHFDGSSTIETSFCYDDADRLVSKTVGGVTTNYTWDGNGNLVKEMKGTTTVANYTWDCQDRLVMAEVALDTANPKTVEFTYCNGCSWGKRFTKKVTDTTGPVLNTRYIWDGDNVIGEVDATTGEPIADYTVMPLSLMSNVLEVTKHEALGTRHYFPVMDAMGTVWQVTDANGAVVETRDFNAWGVPLTSSGLQPLASSLVPLGFQTKEYDAEFGMYYSRARYYDPGTGRFVSPDTEPYSAEESPAESRYVWPALDPSSFGDPEGSMAEVLAGGAFFTLGEVALITGTGLLFWWLYWGRHHVNFSHTKGKRGSTKDKHERLRPGDTEAADLAGRRWLPRKKPIGPDGHKPRGKWAPGKKDLRPCPSEE